MAATVEASKTVKEPRPKRDFLRENREYLRNIQKNQKIAKTKSTKDSEALNKDCKTNAGISRKRAAGTPNDTWKSEPFNRLTAETDRAKRQVDKRFGTFITKNTEPRKRPGVNSNMLDAYVQTCNPELESFLEGATILTPSDAVLEAIRAMKEPPPEAKPRPVKRKIDRHTGELNAHLSDLKEFLEKSSVSRRKRNEIQKNPNIQKFLTRGRIISLKRASRPNIGPETMKVTNESRIINKIKSSILSSAGENGVKSTVKSKLPKLSKRELIGDGPKRPDSNKLIVVYQKG